MIQTSMGGPLPNGGRKSPLARQLDSPCGTRVNGSREVALPGTTFRCRGRSSTGSLRAVVRLANRCAVVLLAVATVRDCVLIPRDLGDTGPCGVRH